MGRRDELFSIVDVHAGARTGQFILSHLVSCDRSSQGNKAKARGQVIIRFLVGLKAPSSMRHHLIFFDVTGIWVGRSERVKSEV